ncbi:MAG: NAD(P)/FAD-dependent oxidoreductase [Methanomassiliicoccales archaeon]
MGDYDVIVVGSGPGGCSTAHFLRHYAPGMRVLLLERLDDIRFQRYHRMCGEAVSARTFRELGMPPAEVVHHIDKVEEHLPGGIRIVAPVKGYILNRPRFLRGIIDRYLRSGGEMAMASVCRVVEEDGFLVTYRSGESHRARYLVGADGAHSTVREQVMGDEPSLLIPAVQHLVDRPPVQDTIIFKYHSRYQGGYRWEFPCGEMTKVGYPSGTDRMEEEVVESHGRPISAGGAGTVRRGNCLLVGDAAGQTNPLTFGGIRPALVAGKMAAQAISRGRPDRYARWWGRSPMNDPDFLRAYRKLSQMSDGELEESMRPLRKGYSVPSYLRAWFTLPEYRILYRAFRKSYYHGW